MSLEEISHNIIQKKLFQPKNKTLSMKQTFTMTRQVRNDSEKNKRTRGTHIAFGGHSLEPSVIKQRSIFAP